MTNKIEDFREEVRENIVGLGKDEAFRAQSLDWMMKSAEHRYTYNFTWLGRPIIQFPQDIVATQELIWEVKPDVVLECGVAHGGSLILSASILAMLDYQDALEAGETLDPANPKRRVIGIDIDIRDHNRAEIDKSPMRSRIEMIQGSAIDPSTIEAAKALINEGDRVLVILDSNHTHEHVLAELEAYAPLVSEGSYCVVFDTLVEDVPAELFEDRPWGPGDNPKTAVWEYLKSHPEFEIDKSIENKLMITVAPDGFLKRTG